MSNNDKKPDITDSNYNVDSSYFFDEGDYVRVIIICYIILSFILNFIIFVSIFLSKKKITFAGKITLNILFVNFIHTVSYLYEWVVKNELTPFEIKDESKNKVGFLITGNPEHLGPCLTQGFSLISSSISQDQLINFFFYLVNKSTIPKLLYIWIGIIIFGFVGPIIFTLIYLHLGALGINDSFCYVKKFEPKCSNGKCSYENYVGFKPGVTTVYALRVLNLIFSCYLLAQIIKYVRQKHLTIRYIFKVSIILLIQMITVTIGVIYRISSYFSSTLSTNLAGPYLILNTVDGVLFPLAYIFSNKIHLLLYNIITGRNSDAEDEEIKGECEDIENTRGSSIAMSEIKEKEINLDCN